MPEIVLPDNIAIDKYGLLFNGERLPFYVALNGDDSFAHVEVHEGMSQVTVTFPADSVSVSSSIEVDADGRVCLREPNEFEGA